MRRPDLEVALHAGDCVLSEIDEESLEVIHPYALDHDEARVEIQFFLRAWQMRHPDVSVELSS